VRHQIHAPGSKRNDAKLHGATRRGGAHSHPHNTHSRHTAHADLRSTHRPGKRNRDHDQDGSGGTEGAGGQTSTSSDGHDESDYHQGSSGEGGSPEHEGPATGDHSSQPDGPAGPGTAGNGESGHDPNGVDFGGSLPDGFGDLGFPDFDVIADDTSDQFPFTSDPGGGYAGPGGDSSQPNTILLAEITLNAFPGATNGTVPEPASMALVGLGLAGLGFARRFKK